MNADEQLGRAVPTTAETMAATRLGVLKNASGGMTEVLRLALVHTVAELGGLGGMAHIRSLGGSPVLILVAASGLPPEFAQTWETVSQESETAPSHAVRDGKLVWFPGTSSGPGLLPLGTGMLAAPLLVPGSAPLGALSVVAAAPGTPSAAQRNFLETVAGLVCERMRRADPAADSLSPRWWGEEQLAETRLQQARQAVRVGSWDWDIGTGEVIWDEATQVLFGVAPRTFDARFETWMTMVHPDDLTYVMAVAESTIRRRGQYSIEYRVCRPDGTVGWVEGRGRVILDEDGEPARMVGTCWDTTEKRVALDSVGRALQHMSDGFLLVDTDWHITFANHQAERLLGPSRELFSRLLWDLPAAQVPDLEARCRQAAADGTAAGFDLQWPTNQRWYHLRVVPGPDGATIYFTDITEKRLADERREAAQRSAAERTTHIGRLNAALAEAVTVADVVDTIAEQVLPLCHATGLVVQLLDGENLRVVGSAGYSEQPLKDYPATRLTDGTPFAHAIQQRAPQYLASRQEFRRCYPDAAKLVCEGGKQAWAYLPLIVSGRPTGCVLVSFSQPHRFSEEERALLTALSGLVAQALERGRLYDAERTRARALQRGLLPRELPSLPAVTAAACYVPATQGLDVGGDWYDVIPLSADRVALVVGDVMGHGLSEAATMGRLRTAVHTLAGLELPPDELLAHLNDLVSALGDDFYATCLYAVYDPTTGVCTLAQAGHPPPALVHPDGTVHFLQRAPDPPLGAATPPFETTELTVPEGSLLVLYTDGLIESAGLDVDSGMAHLAATLTAATTRVSTGPGFGATAADQDAEAHRLTELCTALTRDLPTDKERSRDDAAVLVARTNVLPTQHVASWNLPDEPIAAGQARDRIRHQLTEWHLDDLVTTTELIASELVGNVIRHAKGPIRLRLIHSRSLMCEVSDGSLTTPHIRRALDTDEGGRGLQLITALSQRWGTRYTADGKCIWTEQLLP